MTAAAARPVKAKTPKPPGRVRRACHRKRTAALKAALPYAACLAAAFIGALALHSLGPAILASGAVLGLAIDRLRLHWGWHRSGGKAAMRKRARWQGHATAADLRRLPREGVPIGRVGRREVCGSWQDTYAAYGPPRSTKTNWEAHAILRAPGAAVVMSTRAELAAHTARVRARTGPVLFLNPSGAGGFPSTLGFSPLAGCADPRMAMESAGALIHASPRDPSGKDAYWDHQSKVALQCFLHAAALTPGADITVVRRWASDPILAGKALEALQRRGAPGWDENLYGLIQRSAADERYWSAISSGVVTALAWLDDPALAALACPPPGREFDARAFIRARGTVYAIGADTPHNPQSPYFACFTTYLWNTAKRMAADPHEPAARNLKLDPPLMIVIDEPDRSSPVPLGDWAATAGGDGVTLVTGYQSDAQPAKRFGADAGQVLEDCFTVKLVFGGVTGAIAEKASKWGGEHDTWFAHKKDIRQVRTFPPERIGNLPLGQAFVKHRSTRGFIVTTSRIEDHPLYDPARPGDFAPATRPALSREQHPALPLALLYLVLLRAARNGQPRRAIAPPYAPPAIETPEEVPSWQANPTTSCAG